MKVVKESCFHLKQLKTNHKCSFLNSGLWFCSKSMYISLVMPSSMLPLVSGIMIFDKKLAPLSEKSNQPPLNKNQ